MKKLLFAVLLLLLLVFPKKSFAEVIHSFNTNITAHKDGSMDFSETINYDFEDSSHHGIYRYIPLFTKVGNLYRIIEIKNVSVRRDGSAEPFSINKSNEQIYFKIGNANQTITGDHIYVVFYTVTNGIGSNFSDHDEIYWNLTGNGWSIPIESVVGNVTTDFYAVPSKIICFTGSIGSKEQDCSVGSDSAKTSNLNPEEGLTVVAVYPVNTFPKSILSKNPPASSKEKFLNLQTYFLIWSILNIAIAPVFFFKHLIFKKKFFKKPTVSFEIPIDEQGKRISPALAGTIDNGNLDKDDVSATLFDFAIRKYVKIQETKIVRKLLPDSTKMKIIKLKEGKDLDSFEKIFFDRLFQEGDSININDLKSDFYLTYSDMKDEAFKILINKNYYTENPEIRKSLLTFVAFISLFTGNIILAAVAYYFLKSAIGRTSLGDEIDYKIDGLKLFLKSMDRNYKWQAENFYTVEQMIPYAIALGFIDKFMEALKIIKPDYKPTWYSGYSGNFYVGYAAFYSSMSSSIAPTSSSGAGGGGFSGGGGGGGGGGSW